MTSRERLITAMNHREPDRVPFDLGTTFVTGITKVAYKSLLQAMGEGDRPEPRLLDPVQQLVVADQDILDRLGTDTTSLQRHFPTRAPVTEWEDEKYWMFLDAWGIGWRRPKIFRKAGESEQGGLYYDMFIHPLAGKELDGAKTHPWPDPTNNFDREGIRALAKRLYDETDKGIIAPAFGSGILEMTLWLQGFDQGYMNLLADKQMTCYLLDRITDIKIAYAELMLEAAGEYCHVFYAGGDDVGHQHSPAMRPELFRELMVPRYKRYFSAIKAKAPHIKVFFHSCGCVYPLLPDLIESGIDILNPVQVNAAEMGDTARLKREFGSDLIFWGGIDTQKVMPHGTPQDVKDEVKRRIEDLAPGGGYVFDTVHNIQADVPGENVIAMAEALDEYGWY
ncbi:MAG: uroporphyrinogen decarboxylase family protein [Armatimonadota bacterium]